MTETLLFVDDEANILSAIKRQLRKRYQIKTATSGPEALELIKSSPEFAVIVSDMRMPEMNGVEFLSQVREISPDSVRLMLTGNADQQTAVDAVNQGAVFRFMNKPCSVEQLVEMVEAALKQYRLVKSEEELLEGTVNGAINLLTNLLSMVVPDVFEDLGRLQETAREIARGLRVMSTWEIEMAALLSNIGYVTLPPQTLAHIRSHKELEPAERLVIERLPETSSKLLENIPRLEHVARIVLYQHKNYDGSGFPKDSVAGEQIPIESRILKVLHDLSLLEAKGVEPSAALRQMEDYPMRYDLKVLKTVAWFLTTAAGDEQSQTIRNVLVVELKPEMLPQNPIESKKGHTLIAAGKRLTPAMIERLINYHQVHRVKEPIKVAIPLALDKH